MDIEQDEVPGAGARPTIVVVGNEKGGTGKSTTAVNLAVGLLHRGLDVGALDLDPRQATMSRYLEHRKRHGAAPPSLAMPRRRVIEETTGDAAAARRTVRDAIASLGGCDVIVIDTPGSPSLLSRAGHEEADVLVTPVNDSLLDIDVLAQIDPVSRTVVAPSFYCRMAWEYHNRRIVEGRAPIDWVVIRNRLPHVDSHNRRDVEAILRKLAQRVGFRLAPGLGERVVFRELFLKGLTVLDLPGFADGRPEAASHRAARLEIEALIDDLAIEPRADTLPRRAAGA